MILFQSWKVSKTICNMIYQQRIKCLYPP
jgi:hypothetical protein